MNGNKIALLSYHLSINCHCEFIYKGPAKTGLKKKKKIKAKKAPGRKPRYLQDEKGEWKCTVCEETFKTKADYRHHNDTCIKQTNVDGFKCGACKEVFKTLDTLKGKSHKIFMNHNYMA